MKSICQFFVKFASLIVAPLHCFDRVIFKGHLPISSPKELERFVDYILQVRRSDFINNIAPKYCDQLVEHAKKFAAKGGRTYLYRTGKFRKDEWARQLIREHGIHKGLIGVLCTQETCSSFRLVPGDQRPRFVCRPRQQRVLYYYFLDPQLGFLHVRLQTWLPFTLQVYVNGHDWLAQQMTQKKLGFVQQHNAFTQLDNPAAAQRLADRFAELPWPRILNRLAHQVNPLLRKVFAKYRIRWCVDQAEFATDLLFRNRAALSGLYQKLLEYAVLNFSAKDVFAFLGRQWHPRFDGEVHTDYKADRCPGARIKHRMKTNWLKMYDKFGLLLRVETVINAPREFSVYRTRYHHDGTTSQGWFPMTKEVKGLHHYRDQACACNHRYLDALALVDDPAPAYRDLRQLTEAKVVAGRSYAGFNPARRADLQLFAAVLDGDHVIRGFRNRDIREHLTAKANDHTSRHSASAAIGRLLKRLHVRQLLRKVPRTRRWKITERGRRLLGKALQLYRSAWPELLAKTAA